MAQPLIKDILINTKTHTLVIQRQTHLGKWIDINPLNQDVSIDYARVILARTLATSDLPGPYRLVEYVEVHTKTMEVLD